MKTVLPAVSLSQLSGVSEMAVAAARVVATMAVLNMICTVVDERMKAMKV
jgi:hypothetical protein